jgi:hypothetical protein
MNTQANDSRQIHTHYTHGLQPRWFSICAAFKISSGSRWLVEKIRIIGNYFLSMHGHYAPWYIVQYCSDVVGDSFRRMHEDQAVKFYSALSFLLLVQKKRNKRKRHFLSNRSAGQEDSYTLLRRELLCFPRCRRGATVLRMRMHHALTEPLLNPTSSAFARGCSGLGTVEMWYGVRK